MTSPDIETLRARVQALVELPALLKPYTVTGTKLRLPKDLGDKLDHFVDKELCKLMDGMHYEGVPYEYQDEEGALDGAAERLRELEREAAETPLEQCVEYLLACNKQVMKIEGADPVRDDTWLVSQTWSDKGLRYTYARQKLLAELLDVAEPETDEPAKVAEDKVIEAPIGASKQDHAQRPGDAPFASRNEAEEAIDRGLDEIYAVADLISLVDRNSQFGDETLETVGMMLLDRTKAARDARKWIAENGDAS